MLRGPSLLLPCPWVAPLPEEAPLPEGRPGLRWPWCWERVGINVCTDDFTGFASLLLYIFDNRSQHATKLILFVRGWVSKCEESEPVREEETVTWPCEEGLALAALHLPAVTDRFQRPVEGGEETGGGKSWKMGFLNCFCMFDNKSSSCSLGNHGLWICTQPLNCAY